MLIWFIRRLTFFCREALFTYLHLFFSRWRSLNIFDGATITGKGGGMYPDPYVVKSLTDLVLSHMTNESSDHIVEPSCGLNDQVYDINPELVDDQGFVDILKDLLGDGRHGSKHKFGDWDWKPLEKWAFLRMLLYMKFWPMVCLEEFVTQVIFLLFCTVRRSQDYLHVRISSHI